MLIIYAILLASTGLSSIADASAIKGHANSARPHDEARSIKLVPASNSLDKTAKAVHLQSPILESTKKIYNDESIRRFLAQQPISASPFVAEQQAPSKQAVAPVVPAVASSPLVAAPAPVLAAAVSDKSPSVEAVVPAALAPVVAAPAPNPVAVAVASPVVAPVSPVVSAPAPVSAPVVAEPVVAAVSPVVASPAAVAAAQQGASAAPAQVQSVVVKESAGPVVAGAVAAVIEPKSLPVSPISESVVVAKPMDDLPPQSDRSASPPTASVVAIAPAPVEPAVVKVAEQQAPTVVQPAVQVQPESVIVPGIAQSLAELAQLKDSPLQAKKDEPSPVQPEPVIEVPAPDPGLVLSEPIDSATKLLIDLDEHVQKFLPAEDQQQPAQPAKDQILVAGVDYSPPAASSEPSGKSSAPLLVPYSSSGAAEAIVPPLPQLDSIEKASAAGGAPSLSEAAQSAAIAAGSPVQVVPSQAASSAVSPSASRQGGQTHQNQQQVISQLLDQLDGLQNRIDDTIKQLVARRRYVMSALLRPMGTYVRRVRTNLERLQNRVNSLQAAASSVGGGQNRPGGFVDAAAIETIRRRIDDISKRISDIVSRIRFSLTPTSAPLNSNGRK